MPDIAVIMRTPLTLVVLFLCTFILVEPRTLYAQGQMVDVGIRFWKPSPELVLSSGGVTVDFVQDFGLEEEWFREYRGSIGRRQKLRVNFVRFEYNAEAIIERTIVFQGQEFTVGAPVATDVKWDQWTFSYEWDFVSRPGGFLGLLTDLRYNKVVASLDSPALTSTATTDVSVPAPAFGFIGRGYIGDWASITGEFTGITLGFDAFDGETYDLDIYGTAHFGPHFGISGGYRALDIHYEVDDDIGDLKMKGPYFGAVVSF